MGPVPESHWIRSALHGIHRPHNVHVIRIFAEVNMRVRNHVEHRERDLFLRRSFLDISLHDRRA